MDMWLERVADRRAVRLNLATAFQLVKQRVQFRLGQRTLCVSSDGSDQVFERLNLFGSRISSLLQAGDHG